jgi:hypothetical protein
MRVSVCQQPFKWAVMGAALPQLKQLTRDSIGTVRQDGRD